MTRKKPDARTNYQTPTEETYQSLDKAFDFFNERLFEGRLSHPMFVLIRAKARHGHFHSEQFIHGASGHSVHEIALNSHTMNRDLVGVLATVVHEMVHLEQQDFGKPSKTGHNKQWAEWMMRIGLTPTTDGTPNGKMTGRKVSHIIDDGGHFEIACDELVTNGLRLPWFTEREAPKVRAKDLSKTKFTCPCCEANAWAKHTSTLICGECAETMVRESVDSDDEGGSDDEADEDDEDGVRAEL